MDILLRDMRIVRVGTRILKVLYFAKAALTVGIIVFSALETFGALAKHKAKGTPRISAE